MAAFSNLINTPALTYTNIEHQNESCTRDVAKRETKAQMAVSQGTCLLKLVYCSQRLWIIPFMSSFKKKKHFLTKFQLERFRFKKVKNINN